MTISIVITTYGDHAWTELAWSRAYPSTVDQGADEVLVEHFPDLEIGPARNAAAAKARGDWLIFLDADDELDLGYVTGMRDKIHGREWDTKVVIEPMVSFVLPGGKITAPRFHDRKGELDTSNYLAVGAMLGRDLFELVGGFGDYPHGFEDWSLWAKCWKAGAPFRQSPRSVYIAHVNHRSKRRTMWRNAREQRREHERIQAELFG